MFHKRRKVIIGVCVLMLLGLLLLYGCIREESGVVEDRSEHTTAAERPTVRVLVIGVIEYPPYEYLEGGYVKGPSVEIVQEVFRRMGQPIELRVLPWSRMLHMMAIGDLDAALDVYYTPERNEYMVYPEHPTAVYPQVFFVGSDSDIKFTGSLEDMKEHTINVIRDFSYGEAFDNAVKEGTLTVVRSDSSESQMFKLANGRIDIAADTLFSGLRVAKEMGYDEQVKPLDPPFDLLYSYLTFSKESAFADLQEEYDEVLFEVYEDGTFLRIFSSYDMRDHAEQILEYVGVSQ